MSICSPPAMNTCRYNTHRACAAHICSQTSSQVEASILFHQERSFLIYLCSFSPLSPFNNNNNKNNKRGEGEEQKP